jgi:hypothetical protein
LVPTLLVAFGATPARAAETEPIRIVFHAPAECPDAAAFTGQVTARTRRARLAEAGESARTFTVTITSAGRRTRGQLTIDDPGGPPSARAVTGGTCDEVVSAIGLVVALAIDPHASTAPTPPPPPSPVPPPPPKPRERFPPPPPYDALPWWGPIGAPLPVVPAPEEAPTPRWRFGGGVRLGAVSGVAPSLLFMAGAYVEVARYGAGVLSPAFRLGYAGGDSGELSFGVGNGGRFTLHTARAEGCPVRLAPLPTLPTLAAFPCLLFDAGALLSSGQAPPGGTSQSSAHAWAAPGAGARIQWEVLSWLRLEAEGGVNVRLVQDTFSFVDPGGMPVPVHQVAPAGGFFAGGVGAHFP